MSEKSLVLVDGSSYLFRAFHALPPLTNPDGEPTGAVYGVVGMLKRLIEQTHASHMAVVFDAKGKTFRDDIYPEYKANRPPMPDELRLQIEPLHEIVRALGLPLLCVPGVEADDVLGTLAVQAAADGQSVLMSTGDKDMAQLVNDKITLVNTMSNTTMTPEGVVEKFGVRADQIIDYLALVGDSVDNIPGVNKCGPKTAAKWLAQYDSMQGVIDHADEIKGKVGEYLREAIAHLPMSYQLATIKTDVELEQPWHALTIGEPDREALERLYTRMNFRTWLREIKGGDAALPEPNSKPRTASSKPAEAATVELPTIETPKAPADIRYETVLTQAQLDQWIEKLAAAEVFAFDTETTAINYMQADIVGVSFAVNAGEAAYVPVAHIAEGSPQQISLDELMAKLKPLLEDPAKLKVGQNLKYDQSVLARAGVSLRGIAHDTMLQSYIFNSAAGRHDMDSLASRYLDVKTVKFEEIAGKGAKQKRFDEIEIDVAAHYAAEDADITLRLHQALYPALAEQAGPLKIYTEVEMPLAPVLSAVERNGVLVSKALLDAQSVELAEKMAALEAEAHAAAGKPFNLSSPKQLGELLYDDLGLPVIAKTPKGAPSTSEDVLERLANDHPVPRLVLEYRSVSKLRSTYTEKLPEMIDPDTGRVHTSYHQAVAATGRLSSSDPNLQNIPIRTPEGRRIRQAFIAPEGKVLLAADYSQIELRIMAHLSADEGLLKAFAAGEDIHKMTASEVFDTPLMMVDDNQRRSAKAINFGLIYGMSAFGLAKQLGIARSEAQRYVDLYFERYPGVRRYMEDTRAKAKTKGYVETVLGRRLYLPDINARNAAMRQYAERTAINAPMQGTAADIIKLAMINIHPWLESSDLDAKMIMQVHDELVFEVAESDLEALKQEIKPRMESALSLSVPLVVEMGVGKDWDAAH
ncbi:MAG: DNA polymerase I [Gammaproteobacteria bacterium]|nr:DNA polymerase I [Gammaproteobacteria bacterium]